MAESQPTLEQWQRLYALAGRVRDMAPWAWMEEVDVVGVQHPDTGELGFLSVMGMLGEHYAVSLYLGAEGLYGFWRMEETPEATSESALLEIPQVQLSFEDREELTQHDRDVIKQLGLKYRGRQAWPLFSSYRPGFFPWRLEAHEAAFLELALEQLLEVAPHFRDEAYPELPSDAVEVPYLIRAPEQTDAGLVWHDVMRPVPPPDAPVVEITVGQDLMNALASMPQVNLQLEADLSFMPARIGTPGERPHTAYILLCAETKTGAVLGVDVLSVETTLPAMYGQIPAKLLAQIALFGRRPRILKASSPLIVELLKDVSAALGIQVRRARRLPAISRALVEFERVMGR